MDYSQYDRLFELLNARTENFFLNKFPLGFDISFQIPVAGNLEHSVSLPDPGQATDDQIHQCIQYQIDWFSQEPNIGPKQLIEVGMQLASCIQKDTGHNWNNYYAQGITPETLEARGWVKSHKFGEMYLPIINSRQADGQDERGKVRPPTIDFSPHWETHEVLYGAYLVSLKIEAIVQICQGYLPWGVTTQNMRATEQEVTSGRFVEYGSRPVANFETTLKFEFDLASPKDLTDLETIKELGIWYLLDRDVISQLRSITSRQQVREINDSVRVIPRNLDVCQRAHTEQNPVGEYDCWRYDCQDDSELIWQKAEELIGAALPDFQQSWDANRSSASRIARALNIAWARTNGFEIVADNSIALLLYKPIVRIPAVAPEITLEEFTQEFLATKIRNYIYCPEWCWMNVVYAQWLQHYSGLCDEQIPTDKLLKEKSHLSMYAPCCHAVHRGWREEDGLDWHFAWVEYQPGSVSIELARIHENGLQHFVDPDCEAEPFFATWYPMMSNGENFTISGEKFYRRETGLRAWSNNPSVPSPR